MKTITCASAYLPTDPLTFDVVIIRTGINEAIEDFDNSKTAAEILFRFLFRLQRCCSGRWGLQHDWRPACRVRVLRARRLLLELLWAKYESM